MSTHDLFLVPAEEYYMEYEKLINSFSKKYKVPSFPHVTLLELVEAEEVELVAKVRSIAENLSRIEVEVFGINFSSTASQCVFAQIRMSGQLLAMFELLMKELRYTSRSPFFPHISIIYGDLSPEEKADIAGRITVSKTLLLDKLVIYRDNPKENEWAKVTEFALS